MPLGAALTAPIRAGPGGQHPMTDRRLPKALVGTGATTCQPMAVSRSARPAALEDRTSVTRIALAAPISNLRTFPTRAKSPPPLPQLCVCQPSRSSSLSDSRAHATCRICTLTHLESSRPRISLRAALKRGRLGGEHLRRIGVWPWRLSARPRLRLRVRLPPVPVSRPAVFESLQDDLFPRVVHSRTTPTFDIRTRAAWRPFPSLAPPHLPSTSSRSPGPSSASFRRPPA
jgi:hypothetical protein